jgi:hypothetical protein
MAAGWERATVLLNELQETLEGAGNHERDALWYRVRYTQTVAWLGRKPKEARQAAVDLCATLLVRLARIDHWYTSRRSTTELREFLRSIRPRSLNVLASALQEDRRPPLEPGRPSASHELPTAVDIETLKQQLVAFANAPENPDVSRRFDQEVTHPVVVAYVIKAYGTLDVGTAYNLACYYARIERWAEVEQYLHSAVELGGILVAEQAQRDPALEHYLDNKGNRAKLDKLVEGLRDPDAPSSTLAQRLLDALCR